MERITYTLISKDFDNFSKSKDKKFNLKQEFASPQLKIYILILSLPIIGAIIFLFKAGYNFSPFLGSYDYPYGNTIAILTAIIVIFSLLSLVTLVIPYLFQKFSLKRELKNILTNCALTISEDSLIHQIEDKKIEFPWSEISKIEDTEYNYLIFIPKYIPIIIPKRCFGNEEEGKNFYNKIQTYYNSSQGKLEKQN